MALLRVIFLGLGFFEMLDTIWVDKLERCGLRTRPEARPCQCVAQSTCFDYTIDESIIFRRLDLRSQ
eukprot:COSAG02_NODE_48203_length_335_cov_1.016949_1_plen_66_part_10